MSNYDFRLPDIGEGIAEAEIVTWHVKAGDLVEEDQPLVDVMTDKATVEMTAPVSGRILAVTGDVGDLIAIGAVLASFAIEGDDAGADAPTEVSPTTVHHADNGDLRSRSASARADDEATVTLAASLIPPPAADRATQNVLASPSVRKRAIDLGIDLAQVTGDGARIRHNDLDRFISYNAAAGYRRATATWEDEQVKVIGLRRRIAENMAASKKHIPHFSYVEELDVTRLEEMRAELNSARHDRPRITILPMLIRAFCKTLPAFPMINARFDDEAGTVTRFGSIHLGIATRTAAGLMVPVVRHAEELNIWQLAAEIAGLADAVHNGTARQEQLSGSTLTVSSLGPLGGIATTPIINRPEVAILGPNRVVERPVVRDGKLVAAKMMNLSISCDHRIVDGWDAASFVQQVKYLVETPSLLFVP